MYKKEKSADALEIANLRLSTGLLQPEFAKILKRGVRTVSKWENATKPLKPGIVGYVRQACREYLKTHKGLNDRIGQNTPSEEPTEAVNEEEGAFVPEKPKSKIDETFREGDNSASFNQNRGEGADMWETIRNLNARIRDLEALLAEKNLIIEQLKPKDKRGPA